MFGFKMRIFPGLQPANGVIHHEGILFHTRQPPVNSEEKDQPFQKNTRIQLSNTIIHHSSPTLPPSVTPQSIHHQPARFSSMNQLPRSFSKACVAQSMASCCISSAMSAFLMTAWYGCYVVVRGGSWISATLSKSFSKISKLGDSCWWFFHNPEESPQNTKHMKLFMICKDLLPCSFWWRSTYPEMTVRMSCHGWPFHGLTCTYVDIFLAGPLVYNCMCMYYNT